MSYTKLATPTPSIPLTVNGQTDMLTSKVVQLDSGELVAVAARCGMHPTSGNLMIHATARVVDSSGADILDALGQTLDTTFGHEFTPDEITSCGSVSNAQKCVLMAILGEDTTPMWQDALCATMLANVSIRTDIENAAHSGQVDAGSIL